MPKNTDSIFLELPDVGEKRALALQRKFITLENLVKAEESAVAQCLHVNADTASGILLSARELLKRRNEKKEIQRKSLGVSGTTKEKAAEAQYISDLASAALLAADDTPEYSAKSTQEKCNQ